MALLGADPGRRDLDDRTLAQVDQRHVVAVERLVVALVDDRALAPERMGRHQRRGGVRVLHDAGDRLAVQCGGHPVGLDVEEDVTPVERAHDAALLDGPQLLLARGRLDRRPGQHVEQHRERAQPRGADRMRALRRADLGVVRLQLVQLTGFECAHRPRQRVGRRALEDRRAARPAVRRPGSAAPRSNRCR